MKCAYCGTDVDPANAVIYEGLQFCNSIHRYSYKQDHSASALRPEAAGTRDSKEEKRNRIASIIGGGFGLALGTYAGIHVFVPIVLMVGVMWVLNRTNTVAPEARQIIALLAAQFGWFFLGAVFTGQWELVYIDLVIIGAGMVWLMMRMHAIPVVILTLFELGVLFINISLILQQEIGSTEHRALTVHIILRLLVLTALGKGLLSLRKRSSVS